MVENVIKLLIKAKKQINKSEVRAIEAIDQALKILEKEQKFKKNNKITRNNKALAIMVLGVLDKIIKHLPSIEAIIRSFIS